MPQILRAAGTSALLVTHDQAEALSLAGTVAVMRDGRIEQVGTPEEIYERPRSRWLAEFLGDADVLPGTAGDGVVECELGRFGAATELSGEVEVVIRPESVAIGAGAARREPQAEAVVVARSFYGHDQLVQLELRAACGCAAAGSASRPGIPATACASGSTGRSARRLRAGSDRAVDRAVRPTRTPARRRRPGRCGSAAAPRRARAGRRRRGPCGAPRSDHRTPEQKSP